MKSKFTENDFITDRLKNQTNSAEGSIIPPRLRGDSRVPNVREFQAIKQEAVTSGCVYVFAFLEPEDLGVNKVSYYTIYYEPLFGSEEIAAASINTNKSPVTIRIATNNPLYIRFKIQVVLRSGLSSSLDNSPTIVTYLNPL